MDGEVDRVENHFENSVRSLINSSFDSARSTSCPGLGDHKKTFYCKNDKLDFFIARR